MVIHNDPVRPHMPHDEQSKKHKPKPGLRAERDRRIQSRQTIDPGHTANILLLRPPAALPSMSRSAVNKPEATRHLALNVYSADAAGLLMSR